jgi:AraC-like DNA-binding protein
MMATGMWLGLIIIGAGIQGIVLAFYLLTSRKSNIEANSILALIVFSLSVDMVTAFLPGIKGSLQANPTILLFGPLIYLYIVSLCGPAMPIIRKFTYAVIVVYAIPVIIYLFSIIHYCSQFSGAGIFPFQMRHEFLGVNVFQLTPFSMIAFVANTAVFLWLGAKEIKRHCVDVQNYSSSGSILNTMRIHIILYLAAFSIFVLLCLYIMTGSRILSCENAYQILRWCMTLSIYTLGYIALKKPDFLVITYSSDDKDHLSSPPPELPEAPAPKDGFKAIRDSVLKNKLLEMMEAEKPYLAENLSLQSLSEKLKVHPKMLSTVINSEIGCTFFDFVNKYRINEVKNRLSDESSINQTITMIAFECGFNSKSAFNAIFRKFENTTPTEFREKAHRKKEGHLE